MKNLLSGGLLGILLLLAGHALCLPGWVSVLLATLIGFIYICITALNDLLRKL
jgi:hypothetical protein